MIEVSDRNFMGIVKHLTNYEKLWLWWLIWGDSPTVINDGDCNDY